MKLVVQVKLLPSLGQAAALEATLLACNDAANDQRNLSFALDARTVSLWTISGRLKGAPGQGNKEREAAAEAAEPTGGPVRCGH